MLQILLPFSDYILTDETKCMAHTQLYSFAKVGPCPIDLGLIRNSSLSLTALMGAIPHVREVQHFTHHLAYQKMLYKP